MSDSFVTSIRVSPKGAHEHVDIWVRGQCVGSLVVGARDGAAIVGLLMPAGSEWTESPDGRRVYRPFKPTFLADLVRKCSKCGAPIVWAKHFKTGKANPIDADPVEKGNIVLNDDGTYRVVAPDAPIRDGAKLFVSHFMTCPNAKDFRNR